MKLKKIKGLFVAAAICLFSVNAYGGEKVQMQLVYDGQTHNYSAGAINLIINGKEVKNLAMPPIILNDYTLVPAREVFEQVGAVVGWNSQTQEVYVAYNDDVIALQINNPSAILNETVFDMNIAPKIINDKTMIPLRFVSEAFGFNVAWEDATRTIKIDTEAVLPSINYENNQDTVIENNTSQGDSQATDFNTNVIPAVDVSGQKIQSGSYPETIISGLETPTASSNLVRISAKSEISKVDYFLLPDNRLVIDIYNSEMQLSKTEYIPEVTSAVKKIRTAQNQMEPEKITRIVLELESSVNYSVSLTADRKTLNVGFEQKSINDVKFSSDGFNDYITITSDGKIDGEIVSVSNPDRLVIDFPYTKGESKNITESGKFSSGVQIMQVEGSTIRITIDLTKKAKYTKTVSGNSLTIKLEEPTYKNISYYNESRIIALKKDYSRPININQIIKTDHYIDRTYKFTLPGDYLNIYGYGEYEVNDSNVNLIHIETIGGNTIITVRENKIFAATVTEDNEYVYINLKSPREVYSKIVILDPGHGGKDPGTSGQGAQEKIYTLDISQRVYEKLEANFSHTGIKVYATRLSDVYVDRFARAPFANEIGGDLFVSIHLNSASPNTVPHGTETYYYPHSNDSIVGISTKKTAEIFHKNFLRDLESFDRKVKQDSFTVILDTQMPSVLCEIGFLSNEEEGQKLLTAEYRQKAADSIYSSILEVFGIYTPAR